MGSRATLLSYILCVLGLFVVSSGMARDTGGAGWLLLGWALAGVIALLGTCNFYLLTSTACEAQAPWRSFMDGWAGFFVVQAGSLAALALMAARFLAVLLPGITPPLVAVTAILCLTWRTSPSQGDGKLIRSLSVLSTTLALGLFLLVGLGMVSNPHAQLENTSDPWGGIQQTNSYVEVQQRFCVGDVLTTLMVLGSGLVGPLFTMNLGGAISLSSGNGGTTPRCLFFQAGGVVALCLLVNAVYLLCLPVNGNVVLAQQLELEAAEARQRTKAAEELSHPEAAAVARLQEDTALRSAAYQRGIAAATQDCAGIAVMEMLAPRWAAPFLALLLLVVTLGGMEGLIRQGRFLPRFGALAYRGIPTLGVVIQGTWASLLVCLGTVQELLGFVLTAVLLSQILPLGRHLRQRHFLFLSLPYALCCTVILVNLLLVKPSFTSLSLGIVLLGVLVYFLGKRSTPQ